MSNPEFIIFTGPMFSGKTSRLIAHIDRLTYQQKKFVAFKPKMDDRYSLTDIKTHAGTTLTAISIDSAKDILEHLINAGNEGEDFDVVAVDEAFMIDGVADVLIHLFKLGKTIIISSLEMSASCNHFEEITQMMPWATHVEKCPAVCVICQADAYYTHRKTENKLIQSEIQVGGADLYEPRCWSCHSYTNERDN